MGEMGELSSESLPGGALEEETISSVVLESEAPPRVSRESSMLTEAWLAVESRHVSRPAAAGVAAFSACAAAEARRRGAEARGGREA